MRNYPAYLNRSGGLWTISSELSNAPSAAAGRAMERWCLILVARMVGWRNRTLLIDTTRGCEYG